MFFSFGNNICPLPLPKFLLSITAKLKPKHLSYQPQAILLPAAPSSQAAALKIPQELGARGTHTDQSLAILPKVAGVWILIIDNSTVGQVTNSGHWAELEAQFLLQKSKWFLYFHNYIFFILSALVSRISWFNSFHKSLLISVGSPDITEGRGIPRLAQITAPGSAGASQHQELHTLSHRRFVWMQEVTFKCGAHNLIILLKQNTNTPKTETFQDKTENT